jgi:hypothetical protein
MPVKTDDPAVQPMVVCHEAFAVEINGVKHVTVPGQTFRADHELVRRAPAYFMAVAPGQNLGQLPPPARF